jgi:hypothetical protein
VILIVPPTELRLLWFSSLAKHDSERGIRAPLILRFILRRTREKGMKEKVVKKS